MAVGTRRNPRVPLRTERARTRDKTKDERPPRASAPAKPRSTRYSVKRGESLSTIAKKHGTSLSRLLKLNPQLRNNPKYAGGNRIFRGTKVRLK